MKKRESYLIPALMIALLVGCASEKNMSSDESETEIIFNKELGIEAVPESFGKNVKKNFNRYTKVVAPSGDPIHIVIQNEITDEQAVRCRGILEHFLKDYPGSKYGSDKGAIANKMAENGAILALMNGEDDGENEVRINAQPLFKREIQVEGHEWYTNQDYEYRDAAYEEILHFVHDNGIGVDGPNTMPGAGAEFQKEIRAAQVNGLANKLWADDERAVDWIKELDEENSLSQEYLASVIDTYYGLWGAWNEGDKGMWGLYVAKVRDELQDKDRMAYDLMDNKFFHPYLTYNARIDEEFTGTFSLRFDESVSYSHHSRYLKDITLLGSNDTSVRVNELDNNITGNDGSNTVIFSANADEYLVQKDGGVTTVIDNTSGREGTNTLRNVEKLQFADQTVEL